MGFKLAETISIKLVRAARVGEAGTVSWHRSTQARPLLPSGYLLCTCCLALVKDVGQVGLFLIVLFGINILC